MPNPTTLPPAYQYLFSNPQCKPEGRARKKIKAKTLLILTPGQIFAGGEKGIDFVVGNFP
jgi:hypothetical protein